MKVKPLSIAPLLPDAVAQTHANFFNHQQLATLRRLSEILLPPLKGYDPNPPGYSVHELDTCRMGDDPKTSALNKWSQSHASFVSSGRQNPTMTIVALAMRASEHLTEQMRQGNV